MPPSDMIETRLSMSESIPRSFAFENKFYVLRVRDIRAISIVKTMYAKFDFKIF